MRVTLVLFFACFFAQISMGQGSVLQLDSRSNEILDRLEIKSGITPDYFTNLKPFNRRQITQYAIHLDTTLSDVSSRVRFDLDEVFKDNNEWLLPSDYQTTLGGKREKTRVKVYVDSTQTFYNYEEKPSVASLRSSRYFESKRSINLPVVKYLYKTPANLYEINNKVFHLRVNPIINFQLGVDKNDTQPIFYNQRGLEIRGGIDDRIYFYSNVLESQARFPEYATNYVIKNKAIPGSGLFKNYKSQVFNIENGYDFSNAQAMLGFNVTRHVGVQVGHGRNFIGNGYRSMLMSNFATNYFHMKLNWQVGKFHLQNIFAELAAQGALDDIGDKLIPKKYMAAHYFGFRPFDNFQIGLYEAVMFKRDNGFELQYLNPVILYRTVETYVGSPDNVLVGFDMKWNPLKGVQLYGQFILDEFKFDELITDNQGWWANKYGGQLGIKYIDVAGVESLDIQAEYNFARPYIYSHRDSTLTSYTHYNQALAHPLGANFSEYLVILKYRPLKRLFLEARYINASYGEDEDGVSWGGNPLLRTGLRVQEYGNVIGQGIGTNTTIIGLDLSYQVFHNTYIDLTFFQRIKDSELPELDQTARYFGGGLRMNIGKQRLDF